MGTTTTVRLPRTPAAVMVGVAPGSSGVLMQGLTAPGAPWRVSPEVRTASAPWGPVDLGQKGSCCLAYQLPEPESAVVTTQT